MAVPDGNVALVPAVGLVAVVGLVVQSHGIDTVAEWAALLVVVLLSTGALYVRRRHSERQEISSITARPQPRLFGDEDAYAGKRFGHPFDP
ncbi:hypothetical protein [Micromonospora ureilytica]|uniref:hypothetical protein n=1 Tax=Micromonospora ureilytica TaxID=709868 RepID=UPI001F0BEDDB|nr:hypothetical protein [Micromonospora ureilytica]